jgi:hypothetical protein
MNNTGGNMNPRTSRAKDSFELTLNAYIVEFSGDVGFDYGMLGKTILDLLEIGFRHRNRNLK